MKHKNLARNTAFFWMVCLSFSGLAQASQNSCIRAAEAARDKELAKIERARISDELRGALTQGEISHFAEAVDRCRAELKAKDDGFSCAEDDECIRGKIDAMTGEGAN